MMAGALGASGMDDLASATGGPQVPNDLKGAGAVQHDADALDFSDIELSDEDDAQPSTAAQPAAAPAPAAMPPAATEAAVPPAATPQPAHTHAPARPSPLSRAPELGFAAAAAIPAPAGAQAAAAPAAEAPATAADPDLMSLAEYQQLADEQLVHEGLDVDESQGPVIRTSGAIAVEHDIFAKGVMRDSYGVTVADEEAKRVLIDVISFSETLTPAEWFPRPPMAQRMPSNRRLLVRYRLLDCA